MVKNISCCTNKETTSAAFIVKSTIQVSKNSCFMGAVSSKMTFLSYYTVPYLTELNIWGWNYIGGGRQI